MINVSKAFRKELYEGHRSYLEYVNITLKNEQDINLTNDHLWGGGLSFDDAVSNDNSFDVGAAVINKCTVVINNIYDDFSDYDFGGAELIVYVGLELPDGTKESIRKGTYTVDEAQYNGSIITLTCLDNMHKFDKAYSKSKLIYPATLDQIVRDACDKCDVDLQTLTFPHRDFIVQERPTDEAITFRSIISWAAQIAGCFCRCDVYGRLELKWYNQQALETVDLDGGSFSPWTSGEMVDGGSFSPWTSGTIYDGGSFGDRDNIHHIFSRYSANISVDDVVITGVRVLEKTKEDDKDAIVTYQSGTDGYVISIENNALIQGGSGQSISNWIGEQLIGFRFRKADVSHSSDPTIEAGDVAMLSDRKGNTYRMIVSSTRFTTGGAQSTTSSAQNPARNSAARFSAETKNYVDYRKDIEKERTDREKALENLKNRIDNSSGLFVTEDTQPDGSDVIYMHDKPTLDESKNVWKLTAEAWAVSTDGGITYNAGISVDGDMIARILTVVGVNADWIKTGALSVRDGEGSETFYVNTMTGEVRIRADVFTLASGKTIASIAKEEADKKNKTFTSTPTTPYNVGDIWMNSDQVGVKVCIKSKSSGAFASTDWAKRDNYIDKTAAETAAKSVVDSQTQADILDRLTNNGADKGIYLQNGKLYISFNAARGGTLTLGGANDGYGLLKVLDANGKEIVIANRTGITAKGTGSGVVEEIRLGSQLLQFRYDGNTSGWIGALGGFGVNIVGQRADKNGICRIGGDLNHVEVGKNKVVMIGDICCVGKRPDGSSYRENPAIYSMTDTVASPVKRIEFVSGQFKIIGGAQVTGSFTVSDNLVVMGSLIAESKSNLVKTQSYDKRLLYCYEMPSPMYGDIGEGETDTEGTCCIFLDAVFAETAAPEMEYQVFLQKEGDGDLWIASKQKDFFMVKGTPGLKFAWEVKIRQKGQELTRLEKFDESDLESKVDYVQQYVDEMNQLIAEREEMIYETA